ncbi:hypothetical protein B0H13DRAFT_2264451, partial [Mycena leptocephala]
MGHRVARRHAAYTTAPAARCAHTLTPCARRLSCSGNTPLTEFPHDYTLTFGKSVCSSTHSRYETSVPSAVRLSCEPWGAAQVVTVIYICQLPCRHLGFGAISLVHRSENGKVGNQSKPPLMPRGPTARGHDKVRDEADPGIGIQIKIIDLIESHDIIIFQETFLRQGEERTLILPLGYEVVAIGRPDRPGLVQAWGGIAVVIKMGIQYKFLANLSGPDLVVLDLSHMFLIGAYLLPIASPWREYTDIDPAVRFAEAVTACSMCFEKPLLAAGDINGRIANRIPRGARMMAAPALWRQWPNNPNGTVKEASPTGAFTSFQALGLQFLTGRIMRRWRSDLDISPRLYGREPITQKPTVVKFGPPTDLDILARKALEASLTPDEALRQLYGPVTSVYGIARRVRAAGEDLALLGQEFTQELCTQVRRTADRGARITLCVLKAVIESNPSQTLIIFTASQYAIRSFCYWAGENAMLGWPCKHADVLKCATDQIRRRSAPIEFRYITTGIGNAALSAAKTLARDALKALHGVPVIDISDSGTRDVPVLAAQELDTRKVFSTLPEAPPPKLVDLPQITLEEVVDLDDGHRGRRRYGSFRTVQDSDPD